MDLWPAQELTPRLDAPDAREVLAVSSASGSGVEELKAHLWRLVQQSKAEETSEAGAPWDGEEGLN